MQCISSNPNPYKSLKYAVFGPLYAGGLSNSFCHLTVHICTRIYINRLGIIMLIILMIIGVPMPATGCTVTQPNTRACCEEHAFTKGKLWYQPNGSVWCIGGV